MKKDFISTIIFSFFILIFMVIAPIIIIKSIPVVASVNDTDKINDENSNEEDKDIIINDSSNIKVYLTKEDKVIEVPIEDYVKSVVSSEMLASFNEEALKAQAIAARTFVASRKIKACPDANGGDVCDSTHCQVYIDKDEKIKLWGDKGNEYWDKISKAVDDTTGKVLSFDNELVLYPQFFSTSSDNTENAIDVFSNDIPYLVSVESKGENIAPKYQTEFKFNSNEFVDKINSLYKDANLSANTLNENIEILSRSEAGGIKEIRFGEQTVKGSDFRISFGLSSTNFQYSIDGDNIIFKCKGYGHGVGMSQWGANVMGKNGAKYDEILKHYYTGVDINNLIFKE